MCRSARDSCQGLCSKFWHDPFAHHCRAYGSHMRLSTVILNVGESDGLEEVRRWYEDVLELTVSSEEPGHSVWYEAGEITLGLHVGIPLQHAERITVGFDVDDVDELFRRLSAKGVPFDGQPVDKPWGARAVSTHDPLGHTVTLATSRPRSETRPETSASATFTSPT